MAVEATPGGGCARGAVRGGGPQDPKTRGYLGQPDFQAMMQDLSSNPSSLSKYMNDPRFQAALSVRARSTSPLLPTHPPTSTKNTSDHGTPKR